MPKMRSDLTESTPTAVKLRTLVDDAATAFRDFWQGYMKAPSGC